MLTQKEKDKLAAAFSVKQCRGKHGCGEWKPMTCFYQSAKGRYGLGAYCKRCTIDSVIARNAIDIVGTRRRRRRITLKRFGLSEETFATRLEAQGGACAICGTDTPGGRHGAWHIDHDHSCCPERERCCGECVRGLLCAACNMGLGIFQDDVDRLRSASAYLEAA